MSVNIFRYILYFIEFGKKAPDNYFQMLVMKDVRFQNESREKSLFLIDFTPQLWIRGQKNFCCMKIAVNVHPRLKNLPSFLY